MSSPEEIAHQQELLATYRRNLNYLINQAAVFGGERLAPLHVANQIQDARDSIQRIKSILRGWSVDVADQADDEPRAPTLAAHSTTATTTPSPEQQAPLTTSAPKRTTTRRRGAKSGPDVYIGYNQADKAWVRDVLLPRLENAELTVIIDWRDFEIGVPKLVNIERAVERSRHTLIVMTPEWVASDWNAFQGLLASSEDPSGLQQKLIPLMLKPCKPPSRIAMLEILDITDQAERAAQLERLAQALVKSSRSKTNSRQKKPAAQPSSTPDQAPPVSTEMPNAGSAPPAFRDVKKR